uniref:Uncharacterized protein n=1 Tax=Anguilla anguilla TaxID=7936 RepID=A0A0E9UBW7_ANGAN
MLPTLCAVVWACSCMTALVFP